MVDAFLRRLTAKGHEPRYQGWMQQEGSRRALTALGIKLTVRGTPPANGLIVSNHLSYLDILAIGRIMPLSFISKAEVRSWPVIGYLGECAGTILIDRSKPSGVRAVNEAVESRLRNGASVGLFAEGTTTDGNTLLPFRAPLFRPATVTGAPVWPAAVRYSAPGHSVADEVCYWGDMTLGPHLLHLATIPHIAVEVLFADQPLTGDDPRQLAEAAERAVRQLLQETP